MQRLSPLDIQKQSFNRSLHGYSPEEVRSYLQVVAEELEAVLRELERVTREHALLTDDVEEYSKRENLLKETLLSAQQVSEDVKANARKEAELIIKDAELLADRIMAHAMERVGDVEQRIHDLKLERRDARRKLQTMLDSVQQTIALDSEQEAAELPITQLHRMRRDGR